MEAFYQYVRSELAQTGLCHFLVKVIPGCPQSALTEVLSAEPEYYVKCRLAAIPEKGRANQALIKFLEQEFQATATITRGQTSQIKRLKLSI